MKTRRLSHPALPVALLLLLLPAAAFAAKDEPAPSGPSLRVAVIPFGVTLERYEHVDPASQSRADRVMAAVPGPRMLFVGRLVYYKGLEVLLDAVPELRGRAAVLARALLPGPYTLVLPNPAQRYRWLTGMRRLPRLSLTSSGWSYTSIRSRSEPAIISRLPALPIAPK